VPLTHGPVSAGLTSEVVTFFRALDLVRVSDGGGDEHEDIVVHRIPRPEVHAFLVARQAEGLHVDPKVYAALWFIANP
jgi:ADP-ribose pyrophosphatase